MAAPILSRDRWALFGDKYLPDAHGTTKCWHGDSAALTTPLI
ncbi:hypothetical protein [Sphingomonas sp.]